MVMSRKVPALLLMLAITGWLGWRQWRLTEKRETSAGPSQAQASFEEPHRLPASVLDGREGERPDAGTGKQADLARQGSPLAAKLNAPGQTPEADVRVVRELIGQYLSAMQGKPGRPIGDNADLTRALAGNNRLKLVVVPPGHPAIGASGRMLDRWGTPYHVHPEGGGHFGVRSAGPDRKLFTTDDVIAP